MLFIHSLLGRKEGRDLAWFGCTCQVAYVKHVTLSALSCEKGAAIVVFSDLHIHVSNTFLLKMPDLVHIIWTRYVQ